MHGMINDPTEINLLETNYKLAQCNVYFSSRGLMSFRMRAELNPFFHSLYHFSNWAFPLGLWNIAKGIKSHSFFMTTAIKIHQHTAVQNKKDAS